MFSLSSSSCSSALCHRSSWRFPVRWPCSVYFFSCPGLFQLPLAYLSFRFTVITFPLTVHGAIISSAYTIGINHLVGMGVWKYNAFHYVCAYSLVMRQSPTGLELSNPSVSASWVLGIQVTTLMSCTYKWFFPSKAIFLNKNNFLFLVLHYQ